jgi:hypothetical protein
VALGWIHGIGSSGVARVVAISDTEMIDRRMAMVQKLAAAMDECLDQEQAVLYPPPPAEGEKADVLLSQAITHAHRELAASDARLKVVSLPLRDGDKGGGRDHDRVHGAGARGYRIGRTGAGGARPGHACIGRAPLR